MNISGGEPFGGFKLFRNLAASHQTWNVTKCDENVKSHHFVTVPHSNQGPGSGKIPVWNDPHSHEHLDIRRETHRPVTGQPYHLGCLFCS